MWRIGGIELADVIVTDAIIRGIRIARNKSKLLDLGDDITLEKALKIVRSAHMTDQYFQDEKSQSSHKTKEVNTMHSHSHSPGSHRQAHQMVQGTCEYCGKQHGKRDRCPAYDATCNACGKHNHFVVVCHSKQQMAPQSYHIMVGCHSSVDKGVASPNQFTHMMLQEHVHRHYTAMIMSMTMMSVEQMDDMYINSVEKSNAQNDFMLVSNVNTQSSRELWKVSIMINRQVVKMKIDTAADCSAMSMTTFQSLGIQLLPSTITILPFGGGHVTVAGQVTLGVYCNKKFYWLLVQVVDCHT